MAVSNGLLVFGSAQDGAADGYGLLRFPGEDGRRQEDAEMLADQHTEPREPVQVDAVLDGSQVEDGGGGKGDILDSRKTRDMADLDVGGGQWLIYREKAKNC
ncbi:unnamed protein product [Lactuca virosa]|uniref:Uncharacterized protein n=1 Tax=Lactuca virosa TaxID=75947 RepID=A0AAU9MSA6_9ASTR|nr:unnamed protein product [Lactuca virosa]